MKLPMIILSCLLSGCIGTSILIPSAGLARKNYRVIMPNVEGLSGGGGLLCLPGAKHAILGAPASMKVAKQTLYKKAGYPDGDRSLAFINMSVEQSSACFILFLTSTIKISADLIEYTE